MEYALRAAVFLAERPGLSLTVQEIAQGTQVPSNYLSKVMAALCRADLVKSRPGRHGGYVLNDHNGTVTLYDVTEAVEPIRQVEKCPLGNPAHLHLCPLHRRLDDAITTIEEEFRRTSLAEVLETSAKTGPRCRTLIAPTIRGSKP